MNLNKGTYTVQVRANNAVLDISISFEGVPFISPPFIPPLIMFVGDKMNSFVFAEFKHSGSSAFSLTLSSS
jgi:hypothetical protein